MVGRGPIERAITGRDVQQPIYHQDKTLDGWEAGAGGTKAHITDPGTLDITASTGTYFADATYLMYVPRARNFKQLDTVWYSPEGYGQYDEPYRLQKKTVQVGSGDYLVRYELIPDQRNPPLPGDETGGTVGGITVTLPETFGYPSGVKWYDVYATNVNTDSGAVPILFQRIDSAIQGEWNSGVPANGYTMWEPQTPDLTQKGNYYSFEHQAIYTGSPDFNFHTRFYFGMGTGGPAAESYIFEITEGEMSLLYRDPAGVETVLGSSPFDFLFTDGTNNNVIVIKWDNGTLGGSDGDITVSLYDRFKDEFMANFTINHTAINSGTIGWGTPPPIGHEVSGGLVDYLRNERYEPRIRQGHILESFEVGDTSNYTGDTSSFDVKQDYRVTEGDYLLQPTDITGTMYRGDLTATVSKGHFYNLDVWISDTGSSGGNAFLSYLFALDSSAGISGDYFTTGIVSGGSPDIQYVDEANNFSYFTSDFGGDFIANEWMNLQYYWDDGTLGGNDGDIGVEAFRKFNGEGWGGRSVIHPLFQPLLSRLQGPLDGETSKQANRYTPITSAKPHNPPSPHRTPHRGSNGHSAHLRPRFEDHRTGV